MSLFLPNNQSSIETATVPDQPIRPQGVKFNINFLYILVLTACGVVVFFSGIVIYKNIFRQAPATLSDPLPQPSTSPSPIPTYIPLPQGVQSYRFSHGKDITGPKPTQVVYEPLDAPLGTSQSISLKIVHDQPVTSAVIEIITDHKTAPYTLKLTEGESTNGTWSGSWAVDDTHDKKYGARFIIKSSQSVFDNTMWFRQ